MEHCANCGQPIEDRATPCMSGRWEPLWAHVPGTGLGGYTVCFPQQPNSPRATPAPVTEGTHHG